ncbi:unnamed protein product [Acanthoscelides obtectus]|uniref:Uncharacterized protein n=1 Tax=Acanthoscelides obtectus TaxID=200917 RepID=A0A9P0L3N5_ACAOB|nr:unnamed protein product [Acanthoscelides obtectus]CAK1675364.1 hypothetical protein AOBTE_LOCUS30166 [Acanthoscelides obtectus]
MVARLVYIAATYANCLPNFKWTAIFRLFRKKLVFTRPSYIQASKRNRLSQDKIQKLVAIHSNLVINEKQTFIYDARPVALLEDTGKDYAVLSVHEDEAEIESESDAWSEDSNSDSDENIPLSALVK